MRASTMLQRVGVSCRRRPADSHSFWLRPLRAFEAAFGHDELREMKQTPGITRLLDRLEGKGLVTRTCCTEDRRQVLCSITAEGTALLQRMDEPVIAADARAVSMLNRQQIFGK